VLVGIGLSVYFNGKKSLNECFDWEAVMRLFPMALCFTVAQILSIISNTYFDPGSLKVICQVSLPIDAIFSHIVLNRKFTYQQIQAILLVCVSTIAFFELKLLVSRAGVTVDRRRSVTGLWFVLPSIAFSCAGSVFAEKFIKKNSYVPFYTQKVQLSLGSCVSSVLLIIVNKIFNFEPSDQAGGSAGSGYFKNWELRTWVTLVHLTLVGWVAGLLVKRLSSVVKNLAQSVSSLATFFLSVSLFRQSAEFPVALVLVALCVLQAVVMYASSVESKKSVDEIKKKGAEDVC
jgi:hypothetical protein